jgi:hypothetical protein
LAYVKSSAIMPRQPSVPNFTTVVVSSIVCSIFP